MPYPILTAIWRRLTTTYLPDEAVDSYLARAQTQQNDLAEVTVAVLDAKESLRAFGVHTARRGVQPVWLRITNRCQSNLRLQLVSIDPNYYTPLEAAGVNHFSILKRLSAFGFVGYLFLPLLALVPLKLITAYRANRRMDEYFSRRAFHLRPIPPGGVSEGFIFTPLDAGTKIVHVLLHAIGGSLEGALDDVEAPRAPATANSSSTAANASIIANATAKQASPHTVEFVFTLPVPGITTDYLHRDFDTLVPKSTLEHCDVHTLVARLEAMPATTTNAKALRLGDPANLVIIGDFARLIGSFAARWDESETITLETCWKTTRAFLLGSDYRYSPVSPLHLFGRSQDVALQRTRRSINERLHLRLWLTPLCLEGQPVWVGQVSRDIGVRFTTKAWNLTTHRIDPDVDEARDYVIEDLLQAERIQAAGYVDGVGACTRTAPRHNLTGDPYFTDGKRAVIMLSATRTLPRFVAWT